MLIFKERGKPEYPEKNLSEQGREPTTNSTHTWRRRQDSNPGHIAGRRVLSPPRHPCSQRPNTHPLGLIKPSCFYPRLRFICFILDFQIRLTGSNLSSAGTINVLYYGIWGGILSHNVDIRVGHVICRQLGYSRAERILRYPSFGRVIGPLWIWSIQCNGNEIEISQCKVETWDKIWNTSWYHQPYHRYNYQQPGYAASLLCSNENSSLSKGKYGDKYLRKQPSFPLSF